MRSTLISWSILILFLLSGNLLFAQRLQVQDSAVSKIAPSVRIEKGNSTVRVLVENKQAFRTSFRDNFPGLKLTELTGNLFEIPIVELHDLKKLERDRSVIYIDRSPRVPKEERALIGFDFSLNNVAAVQSLYPALTGEGLVISIKEKPFDLEDIDLKNRIVLNDQFDEASTPHATIMATIVAGAGNSEPTGKGVAPSAKVTTSDFLQLSPDNGNTLTTLGVSVQNHSYGVGVENYYGIESAEYDKHCQDFATIVHVFSSGNEGDISDVTGAYSGITGFANLTGQFKNSKNTISVGSLNVWGIVGALSSRGPAQDGRVKPDVTAFGDAGSSESAAFVSGIASLIQQSHKNQEGVLPPASLVKAILLNSADDVGRAHVDFETGFGNADALGSVRTVELNHFISGSVTNNDQDEHFINVPAGTHLLKVTLAWNDKEALPNAGKALVNDLDLELRHVPSGDTWKPWTLNHFPHRDSLMKVAVRKDDHLNTVEQVTIENPVAGSYALKVAGYDIQQASQAYSLAYEFESGFEWTYPVTGTTFAAASNTILRWRWSEGPGNGALEYRYAGESNWIEINSNAELAKGYAIWTLPDTSALVQLRLNGIESEIFPVSKPINLKVGYNCEDEAMLLWNKTLNAQQYQLYRLGDSYLEPFILTTDTFAILDDTENDFLFYSVVPVISGMEGERGATENYTLQGTDCYVMSFLPRQYVVTDETVFDLTIGTSYGLDSITLERLGDNSIETIHRVKPVTTTSIAFSDQSPRPGMNSYRVRIDRSNGEFAYSQVEQILFPRKQDIFIYPNPVLQGASASVVIADKEAVDVKVYDFMGKLIAESKDDGEVKTIDASSLIKGTYIVEVLKSNGSRVSGKLIVW